MKIQNNKTKTATTILFATIMIAMMVPVNAGNLGIASAEKQTGYTKAQLLGLIEKHKSQLTRELTQSELDKIDEKVKLDNKVQALVANDSLKRVGYSSYVNVIELENHPNTVVDIVMNYIENGKSLTVLVDGATNSVLDLQERPIGVQLLPNNGLVADIYGGPTINGIRLDFNSPNFTPTAGHGPTFVLVNALKSGSSTGNPQCDPTAFPGTYWAQSGEELDSNGPELVWADTTTSCHPQDFSTPTIRPSIGNSLDFEIQVDSTGRWVLFGLNVSTGGTWTHAQTVSGNKYFDSANAQTNVFFENPNHTTDNWASEYHANPIMADGLAQNYATGVWDYWQTETLQVYNCYPGMQPISYYETGTLKAGTLTYNTAHIQSNCAVQ